MNLNKLNSMVSRIFFGAAFVLFAVAVMERVLNLVDVSILKGSYTAGRLVEFSGILMVFVIALLLRQMRDELRKKQA